MTSLIKHTCPDLGETRVFIPSWQPSSLVADVIEREFLETITEAGIVLPKVRLRSYEKTFCGSWWFGYAYEETVFSTADFHPDCGGDPRYLIIWSNYAPTEVKFSDGSMLKANDGDVLLVNNLKEQHRRPRGCPKRSFARVLLY